MTTKKEMQYAMTLVQKNCYTLNHIITDVHI